MSKKFITKIIFVGILLSLFNFSNMKAAEEENNVTINPPKFDISVSPGDVVTNYLRVTNNNDYEMLVSFKLENIGIVREDGEVVIGGTHSGYPSILNEWVKFEPEAINIKGRKTGFIKMTISVPENGGYGGRYSSIIAKQARLESPDDNGTIATLASLIMLNILGDTNFNANVQSLKVKESASGGSKFNIDVRIQNTGNNHIRPYGMIVINNFLGKKVDEVYFEGDNVLPGAIRKSSFEWEPKSNLFGLYNVALIASYGFGNDKTMTSSTIILVHPYIFSFVVALILAGIIYIIILLRRRFHKKRSRKVSSSL